MLIYKEL